MENYLQLPKHKISLFVQITGFIFFGILFYFAWTFYLERMLYVDNALYFFQILEGERFVTNLNRYGDYIPQLLPLLAYKMDYPLHTILILYSVSFILLHYLIFLFVTLILKNNGAGIAIMLASCLSYYHAFYTPLVQLHESIIAAVLLWAFIHPETPYSSAKEKYLYLLGALATVFYMSMLHPLGLAGILFVIGTEIIGAKRYKDIYLWAILAVAVGWFYVKFGILYRTQYDRDHMIPLSVMWQQLPNWRHWLSTAYIDNFTWLHFRSLKWLGVLLVLLSLRKGIVFFLFVLLFVAAFTTLYLVTLYKGESPVYYEEYYIYYGFFFGIIFSFLFYHPRRRNLVMLLAVPLLYSGIHRIYNAHYLFTDRVEYLNRIVDAAEKTKEKKGIIDSKCYPFDYAMVQWNVAFETLICSSLRGKDSTVTLFVQTPDFLELCTKNLTKPNAFMGTQFAPGWYGPEEIPEEYFKLPATSYTYLTHSQDDSSFHDEIFSANNLKIVPLKENLEVKKNNLMVVIPLEIVNTSGRIMPAVPRKVNPINFTYTLYDTKGGWAGIGKQPLETDAGSESKQGLGIDYSKLAKGTYIAKINLTEDGKGNWKIPCPDVIIKVE